MLNKLTTSKVNYARLSAAPLPSGFVFYLADGMRCPSCDASLRCDPEVLDDGASFALDCHVCFRTIIRVE
jgi:hypothetical protein